jgi:hypothetical protein
MVLRTWNEHEEINETSFYFELFCRIGRFAGPDEKNGITHHFLLMDSLRMILHGLLEVLEGSRKGGRSHSYELLLRYVVLNQPIGTSYILSVRRR